MSANENHKNSQAKLSGPRYLNRELSWLDFNLRVLLEAKNQATPLLEKVKFLTIFHSNLEEFFMVRVAGLRRAVREDLHTTDSPDQAPPAEILQKLSDKSRQYEKKAQEIYLNVLTELNDHHIQLTSFDRLCEDEKRQLTEYFYLTVFPILTPLAVDPAHPFPFLANQRLYLLITFATEQSYGDQPPIAFVEIPDVLPRLIEVSGQKAGTYKFVFLEELIAHNLDSLFAGYEMTQAVPVRVIRDLDFTLLENDVVDLLQSVQKEVKNRGQAAAVRLDLGGTLADDVLKNLTHTLGIQQNDVYYSQGPLNFSRLKQLYQLPLAKLKDKPFNPRLPKDLIERKSIFGLIRDHDILIHQPYESFYTVIEFLNTASNDPDVLAIKQTLYRTSGDSPIIDALIHAAENGKQVTAVVELKARFDEKNNIIWARQMEQAGVNVVFGFIGLKTHAKTTLVVRKEGDKMRRYVHLSTGNYNSSTAKTYVDLGLLTADPEMGQDISTLFNLLTGFNIFTKTPMNAHLSAPEIKKLTIAPLGLRDKLIELIEQETAAARKGEKALIKAKMNALVDKDIIDSLYEASKAGVEIFLMVRGICCLIPKVKGMSENIQVVSLVDRFLEHSRIFYFYANGRSEVFLSSADWMPRNMDRRVELMFPILDERLKSRIIDEILGTYEQDHLKTHRLQPDGTYTPPETEPADGIRAQSWFIERIRESGLKSIPYDKAIRQKHHHLGPRPLVKKGAYPRGMKHDK